MVLLLRTSRFELKPKSYHVTLRRRDVIIQHHDANQTALQSCVCVEDVGGLAHRARLLQDSLKTEPRLAKGGQHSFEMYG
ncbi:hypothetical protein EYF80_026628 [Liparis tanakae]|uniref:Uncharacterized protein n=1 Tax=Liparis tanakae TaxID=230148 RepID=A0A4Z2HE35_9TELE|nr:hypothetical protein EYF80_026628 [Liparis tanakae]